MNSGKETMEDLIRESNIYLGILARAQLRDVIARELKDDKRKNLYAQIDGAKSNKELSVATGMATGTVSETLQHWEDCGMVVKSGRTYKRSLG